MIAAVLRRWIEARSTGQGARSDRPRVIALAATPVEPIVHCLPDQRSDAARRHDPVYGARPSGTGRGRRVNISA